MLVTFCGHKDVAKEAQVKEKLEAVIASLIEEGATEFYLGGYGSFDSMAAKTVREMKKTHPEVQGILVIPYMDRDYNKDLYDGSVYPPIENAPLRFAISKRNEWMVDQADVVVAYVTHDWGGANTTLEYAKRKKKRIISVVPKKINDGFTS